ncbi:MAG: hypothetical protein VB023_04395 [Oscillibacter sp.]|nr:hypothetical protein [Oscillibacter sp.]
MSRTREENRKLAVCVRRRATEKELRLSAGYIKTKEEYERAGAAYLGTLGSAAKAGYYTVAGCGQIGLPVTDAELMQVKYFAMFADCYSDQCLLLPDGSRRRPCLPVFFRPKKYEKN